MTIIIDDMNCTIPNHELLETVLNGDVEKLTSQFKLNGKSGINDKEFEEFMNIHKEDIKKNRK